ncbi:MAG: SurA N-terminal domain-containing protein [Alphaproteobacteria bacterium]
MLSALRNASKSWVMKGILILLAATFVVFFGGDIGGGGGHGGSGGGSSVLEVGDQNFTIHQVGREFNEDVAQISARTGQRLDTQTAINIGILDQTIARMASQALFDQAAQNLGVTASLAAASDAIRSLPQFQDSTGRFNRTLFETFLGNLDRAKLIS